MSAAAPAFVPTSGSGYDEPASLPSGEWQTRKVFVGGLPSEATVEQMRDYFSQYGHVEDVLLMMDRATGRPRGQC